MPTYISKDWKEDFNSPPSPGCGKALPLTSRTISGNHRKAQASTPAGSKEQCPGAVSAETSRGVGLSLPTVVKDSLLLLRWW